jgi:hypothetical protein
LDQPIDGEAVYGAPEPPACEDDTVGEPAFLAEVLSRGDGDYLLESSAVHGL